MFKAEIGAGRRSARPAPISWHREHELPPSRVVPSLLAAAAGLVAMWPFTAVIEPGAWSFAVLAVIVATAVAGILSRTLLRRASPWLRDLGSLGAQLVVAVGTVTQLVAGDAAFFGVIPTESTVLTFRGLAAAAWEEVVYGSAPLDATPGLEAVMAAGFAVLAILLDQLVAQRSAVVACLLAAAAGATPMIVTGGDVDVVWFVMFGLLTLAVLGYTASQNPSAPRRPSLAVAAGVGAVALVTTMMVAPGLPVTSSLSGTGVGVTVDASLRLGDDLRQPDPVEVLTLATSADSAPYLRLTTLSDFDGRVWEPDKGDLRPQADGFGPTEWEPDIAAEEQSTSIRVIRMSSSWLPVPYPATGIQGIPPAWRLSGENRTVSSRTADAAGNDYTVRSVAIEPTLEQIRATPAAPADTDGDQVDLPDVVADTAAEVTAQSTNDYDRLVALQSWFRTEFSYSLETPVDEGFDGTGADAVAQFLDVRSGYCIHFAGAFALMAESLDMDVRIVVGYLPGVLTETERGEESVYSVSSDQLHSWPEVHFPGIGWVPFEPTASLGVPTAFASGTTTGGGASEPSEPAPSSAPSAEPSEGPEIDRGDAGDDSAVSGDLRTLDPTPVMLLTFGVALVLLLPALIRLGVRSGRRARTRRGDAGAAWEELRATMLDLHLPVSDAESPRMRAADLVRDNGADAGALRVITDAVERSSYARAVDAPGSVAGQRLDEALGDVTAQLRHSVDRGPRLRAFLIPRSLFASRRADVSSPA